MYSITVWVCKTKYSFHGITFQANDNYCVEEFYALCEIMRTSFQLFIKKIDFLADGIPIIDEINLLKSYCHTFDDKFVNEFAKEEIKGRYRAMLGLESTPVTYDYGSLLKYGDKNKIDEIINFKNW